MGGYYSLQITDYRFGIGKQAFCLLVWSGLSQFLSVSVTLAFSLSPEVTKAVPRLNTDSGSRNKDKDKDKDKDKRPNTKTKDQRLKTKRPKIKHTTKKRNTSWRIERKHTHTHL